MIDVRDGGPSPISPTSPNIPLNPDTKIKIIKKTDLDKLDKVNSTAMQTERVSSEASLRLKKSRKKLQLNTDYDTTITNPKMLKELKLPVF